MTILVVVSALQFFTDSARQLIAVRLLIGMTVGIQYSVGVPLLSEFAPTRQRGRLLSLTLFAWYLGFTTAGLVGYLLDQADVARQTVLATSLVIAVALLIGQIGLPESPR